MNMAQLNRSKGKSLLSKSMSSKRMKFWWTTLIDQKL